MHITSAKHYLLPCQRNNCEIDEKYFKFHKIREDIRKFNELFQQRVSCVQNEENKRAIANLSHELAHSEEKFNHELNLRIKLEKELAVVGQQLTMTSSDKQFLERDRQDEKSKNHGLNLDLRTVTQNIGIFTAQKMRTHFFFPASTFFSNFLN